jgi:hypothetical protein
VRRLRQTGEPLRWAVICVLLGGAAQAKDAADLAQDLANPLAAILSAPLLLNSDGNLGPDGSGGRTTLGVQPVIPFALGNCADIITRTRMPCVRRESVTPGASQSGFGDILASAWRSRLIESDLTRGVGPTVRLLAFAEASRETWATGAAGIALQQTGPWTLAASANHIRHLENSPAAPVDASFVPPFVACSTEGAWTFSLQSKTSYDRNAESWPTPASGSVSKLAMINGRPVGFTGGVGDRRESPGGVLMPWSKRAKSR